MLRQGLEAEVQKLLQKHRVELEAANARAAEDTKRQLEDQRLGHDNKMKALRDRLQKVRLLAGLLVHSSTAPCLFSDGRKAGNEELKFAEWGAVRPFILNRMGRNSGHVFS